MTSADDAHRLRMARVEPGSPAAKAGLTAGDTVVEGNGKETKNFVDWAEEVASRG